jgi:ssDNA-binding Zn-finger/Zn-ribbon topoisomerase 1
MSTKHKFIAITGCLFRAYKLSKTAGKVIGINSFIKNKHIISYNNDNGLCFWFIIGLELFPETKNVTGKGTSMNSKTALARKAYEKVFGLKCPKDYQGANISADAPLAAKIMKKNINFYSYDDTTDKYHQESQVIFDTNCKEFLDILLVTGNNKNGGLLTHAMKILDVEAVTGIHICPKCKSFCMSAKKYTHKKFMFDKHVKECDGKFKSMVKLNPISLPYVPHIQNNNYYAFLIANGRENEFQPIRNYITYDFETASMIIEKSFGDASTLDSTLHPISVAHSVRINGETTTKSFYINTKNEESFINEWMNELISDAEQVYKSNIRTNIPQNEKTTKFDANKLQARSGPDQKIQEENVSVLGFNSSRFDINLIIKYLNRPEFWTITSMIGSATDYKQIIVHPKGKEFNLRFIDMQAYIAGGTLDQASQNFGNLEKREKGFFPYELITMNNFVEVLNKTEPFEKIDFYSSLTKQSITDSDYEIYLNDFQNYSTRKDYLLHYNEVDTQIMIPALDNLINMFFEYKVDMLHNLSLSSNASQIKYALAYRDFDINGDYSFDEIDSGNKYTI